MSNNSSARNSPYGSNTDLQDDASYSDVSINPLERKKSRRGSKKNLAGGVDLDDAESNLRQYQQETSEYTKDLTNIRGQSQAQARKVHDLQLQFDEARIRIDKLLQRKSRSRSDFDADRRTSVSTRTNISANLERRESATKVHKSSVTVNPASKLTFAPVSLTVHVDSD